MMEFTFVTIFVALLCFQDVRSFTIDQVMISSSCCCETEQSCCANEENARKARNAEPVEERTLRRRKRESEESQSTEATTDAPSVKINIVMHHTNLIWDEAMKDPQSLQYINTVKYLQSMMDGVLQHVSGYISYKIRRLMEGSIIQSGVAEIERASAEKYDIVTIMQQFLQQAIDNPASGLAQSGGAPPIIRVLPDPVTTAATVTEISTQPTVSYNEPMLNLQDDKSPTNSWYPDTFGENRELSDETTQLSTTEGAWASSTQSSDNQIARVTIALRFKNMTWNPAMLNHKFLQFKRTAKTIEEIMDEALSGVEGFKFYRVTNLQEGSVIQTGYAEMRVKRANATLSIAKMKDRLFEAIENPTDKLAEGQAEIVDPNEIQTTTRTPRTRGPAELAGMGLRFSKMESFINDRKNNNLIPVTSETTTGSQPTDDPNSVSEGSSSTTTDEASTDDDEEDDDDIDDDGEDEVDAKDEDDEVDTIFDPRQSNVGSTTSSSLSTTAELVMADGDVDYDEHAVDSPVQDKMTIFVPAEFSFSSSDSTPELKSISNIPSSTEKNQESKVANNDNSDDTTSSNIVPYTSNNPTTEDTLYSTETGLEGTGTDNMGDLETITDGTDDTTQDSNDGTVPNFNNWSEGDNNANSSVNDNTENIEKSTTSISDSSSNNPPSENSNTNNAEVSTDYSNKITTEGKLPPVADDVDTYTESNEDANSSTESNNDVDSDTGSNTESNSVTENNDYADSTTESDADITTDSDDDVGSDTEYVINDVTDSDAEMTSEKSDSTESFFHLDNIGVEDDDVITENSLGTNDTEASEVITEMIVEKSDDTESFFHLDGIGVEDDATITEIVIDVNGTKELNATNGDNDADNDVPYSVTAEFEANTEKFFHLDGLGLEEDGSVTDMYGNVITIEPELGQSKNNNQEPENEDTNNVAETNEGVS